MKFVYDPLRAFLVRALLKLFSFRNLLCLPFTQKSLSDRFFSYFVFKLKKKKEKFLILLY